MAKIVFADGSKQMSHNLDDLYQRWQMRREEVPEPERKPETAIEVFAPPISKPETMEETEMLQTLLRHKRRLLIQELTTLKSESARYGWSKQALQKRRAPIVALEAALSVQLGQANAWLKEYKTDKELTLKADKAAQKAKKQAEHANREISFLTRIENLEAEVAELKQLVAALMAERSTT